MFPATRVPRPFSRLCYPRLPSVGPVEAWVNAQNFVYAGRGLSG